MTVVWDTRVRSAAVKAADFLRPDLASPSAPLATAAWLDSFTPSLMPRTSVLQGVLGGLAVLSARVVASTTERLLSPLLGEPTDLLRRLPVRAGVAAVGLALGRIPERPDERLWAAGLRDGGEALRSVAVGGVIHDVGRHAWDRQPDRDGVRTAVATASVVAGVSLWARRRLQQRTAAVAPWPVEQHNSLPAATGVTAGVVLGGRMLGVAVGLTRAGLRRWLGPARSTRVLADVMNAGLWSGIAVAGYHAGVARAGLGNGRVEPGYDRPPGRQEVSGGPGSHVRFAELGRQGRRFVTDVVQPEQIVRVMGPGPVSRPVRVYVGLDAEPLYPTGRAEVALEELERTGAYQRSVLLLVSPTGTGWVDQTLVESAELFTRGDIATVTIQYGAFPSFLAMQKVALGRSQFRLLLLGVRERLRGVPPGQRPRVLVFGESMGAWTASDVIMHQGIGGFDHYGIERALWVGLPWLAKWSRSGMIRGSSDLVPEGTVGVFDRVAQLQQLGRAQRDLLRAVILSHDNDPLAVLGPDLAVRRPDWLERPRGRGVPADMRWTPVVTFLQTAVDALNSMVQVPGAFTSYGHDYRGDMARIVHAAFGLPAVGEATMRAVEAELVRMDLARARRLGRLPL